jgi:hypothetical protein
MDLSFFFLWKSELSKQQNDREKFVGLSQGTHSIGKSYFKKRKKHQTN